MIIYLGGCAWGCGYYIGIFKAIKELYPDEEIKILVVLLEHYLVYIYY